MTADLLAPVTQLVTPFATVFASALRGDPCVVWGAESSRPLPVSEWTREVDAADRALLAHCQGPTLDIGCGPGRMSEYLARRGHVVLGVDLVPEAVRQTRARGASALVRNVFEPLPAEGRWGTALLADGNIGIGGDPVALLDRVRSLLAPGGRAVVDVAEPGVGVLTRMLRIESPAGTTRPFPWTFVGADAIGGLAEVVGLTLGALHVYDGGYDGGHADRRFAVLVKGW